MDGSFFVAELSDRLIKAMKLQAEIGGQTHSIEIKRDGSRLTATVDGRAIDAEVSEPESGVFLFKLDGRIIETYVGPFADSRSIVSVGGRDLEVTITDPKRLRGSASGGAHDHGHAEIKTAMPGKVVRILRKVGDHVTKGEGVIVVEAMKMQNEMKSPRDGTIGEVRVTEGDTVGAGDVLVVID